MRKWFGFPFGDAPDTAALTCCHVLEDGEPILHVSHDADDGMWQFLCERAHDASEARVVSLASVYRMDRSIGQLARLARGCAADRDNAKAKWQVHRR